MVNDVRIELEREIVRRLSWNGDALRKLREDRLLSLRELAQKLGVTHVSVVYWENNTNSPRFNHVCRLCEFFGVKIDAFVKTEVKKGKWHVVK